MRLFVTGSTGFIGSHFVRAALAAGHEVIGLRYPGTQPVIPIPDSDHLTWVEGDLTSFLTDYVDSRSPERVAPSGQSSGLSTRAVPSATCSAFPSPLSPPSAIIPSLSAEGRSPSPSAIRHSLSAEGPPPFAEGPSAFPSSPPADISAFHFPPCSASASVAFPATPSTSPSDQEALSRGCSAFSPPSSSPADISAFSFQPSAFPSLPGADEIMHTAIFLGTYPGLTPAQIAYEIATIREFVRQNNDVMPCDDSSSKG